MELVVPTTTKAITATLTRSRPHAVVHRTFLVAALPMAVGKPTFHDFVHAILPRCVLLRGARRSHFPPASTTLNDGTEEGGSTASLMRFFPNAFYFAGRGAPTGHHASTALNDGVKGESRFHRSE